MKPLSNAEFMLLQILQQEGELSGYQINALVQERGYRSWADVGMTSIYVSLSKLAKKELVDSSIDTKKTGKGPIPKKFKLLKAGLATLRQTTLSVLSSPESKGARFSLGLSASNVINNQQRLNALKHRQQGLQVILKIVREEKYLAQGGDKLPQPVQWLFKHSFMTLETEIKYTEMMINDTEIP